MLTILSSRTRPGLFFLLKNNLARILLIGLRMIDAVVTARRKVTNKNKEFSKKTENIHQKIFNTFIKRVKY